MCLPIPPYPHVPTTAIAQERLLYTARKEPSPFITVRKEPSNIYNPLLIVSDKLCCWLYVIIISHFLFFVNRILKKINLHIYERSEIIKNRTLIFGFLIILSNPQRIAIMLLSHLKLLEGLFIKTKYKLNKR